MSGGDAGKIVEENLDYALRLGAEADRLMSYVLFFLWVASFGFAWLHGTWLLWAIAGTSISAGATLVARVWPGSLASRLTMAAGLMLYSALLIDQAHGIVETHFGIFALLAFLLYYRDWRPVVFGTAVIALHHVGFYWLQSVGVPLYVFPHTGMPMMVVVHAAYVVVETVVLVKMALGLHQEMLGTIALASLGVNAKEATEIDLDPSRVEDAGVAGRGVAQFLEHIRTAIAQAGEVSDSIQSAAVTMADASSEMVKIREHQQEESQRVVQLVQSMGSVAGSVSQRSESLAAEAQASSEAAGDAQRRIESTSTSLQKLVGSVEQTATEMERLEKSTERIGKIVEMIEGIAGQTNLLALNASIEAARAGESGRSFAVVAQEVRRLSESTREFAAEIQQVVIGLREATQSARTISEQSKLDAEVSRSQMQTAWEQFQAVSRKLPEYAQSMSSLVDAMAQQQNLMQQVTQRMTEDSQYLEATSSTVHHIRNSGELLQEMSRRLQSSVQRFRLDKPANQARPTRPTNAASSTGATRPDRSAMPARVVEQI